MSTAFTVKPETIIHPRSDGVVALADRDDAVRPANAKRSDVKKILKAAALHFEELAGLWEDMHGKE